MKTPRSRSGNRQRGKPAARSPPTPFTDAAGSREAELVRKYKLLCGKYEALVHRHEALVHRHEAAVRDRSGTVMLALRAMRSSTSAMALLEGTQILSQNSRWYELEHLRGEWRVIPPEGSEAGTEHRELRELAAEEARAIRVDTGGERVIRAQHSLTELVAEVHLERPPGHETVAAIAHDVTERVRMERELEAAQQAMFEQERLRAVGELASGVAHDLNNTLQTVAMHLQLLRRTASAAQTRHLDVLSKVVKDAADRIGRVQEFARRRQDAPAGAVDLGEVIRDAVEIASPEIVSKAELSQTAVTIQTDLPAGLPPVSGNASELRHVFVNLLVNARDAMPSGGAIRVAASEKGEEVRVTVSDEGTGIAPENLGRVFDPFFTTKGARGTGLGLAVAHGVMRRLGGSIAAANDLDRGAVLTLRFPSLPDAQPHTPEPEPIVRPGQRILVVDDQDALREAVREVLDELGQCAEMARTGREAIERIRSGEHFDHVLCDLGMPEMSGWQVAEAIRALAPDTRIHLITGWAAEIAPDDPRRRFVDGVLAKPLDLADLERLLVPIH
ncbi:MAG TPA: ATP-binding protein [Myxococcaceae bacterium]|nr:ATP-binding protein [Myxococcaceae bacterium]